MKSIDLLVTEASQVLTLAGPARQRCGPEMSELSAIPNGTVAVDKGLVVETGSAAEMAGKYRARKTLEANGRLVLPGFVDPHTHLVFAGTREYEMAARLAGDSYLDILAGGGGIHGTVEKTRKASFDELLESAKGRMQRMLEHGTTAVEIKSGYGLEPETEFRILDVANRLRHDGPCDVAVTFLGGHVVPKDTGREAYVSWLSGEALDGCKGRAEFVDVFCDQGAFTLEESVQILKEAKARGFGLKIHAGQFRDLGAAGAAASLGAISADHLEHVSADQLAVMKKNGTIAVLLPGASFFLGSREYPDAKAMEKAGVAIALSTDFNPGSCPSYSMQMMIALACHQMGMSAAAAVTASTVNAAYAMGRGGLLGTLEPGKQADLIVLDVETPEQIPYFYGVNLVRKVVKKGRVVVDI
ncbi:imidazolonepropionase [bacterium]|nr:imidazolonepropionase [bacterium]